MTLPSNTDSQHDQANDKPKRKLAQPTMSELEDILHNLLEFQDPWSQVENAEKAIQTYTDRAVTLGRIDTLNQIRHSDTKLNHGTIELMGHVSQELNKQKLALTISVRDGGSPSDGGKT